MRRHKVLNHSALDFSAFGLFYRLMVLPAEESASLVCEDFGETFRVFCSLEDGETRSLVGHTPKN